MITNLKCVIFDMDGVIVDTEPVHYYAYHELFKQLNINVTDEFYGTFTGNSTKNVFQKIKAAFDIEYSVEELVYKKRQLFNNAFDSKPDLYLLSGVEELIKHYYDQGIKIILASSSAKETIKRVFDRFNLHPFFSHIVSGEDFPKSKPDPAIFNKAVELSGFYSNECIVIEDSTNGILAAKSAGIYCVGYKSKNSIHQNYEFADQIIEDFSELL